MADDPAMARIRARNYSKETARAPRRAGTRDGFQCPATLQRRVKAWRSNRARELVTRILGDADAMKAGAATQRQPSSQNNRKTTISLE